MSRGSLTRAFPRPRFRPTQDTGHAGTRDGTQAGLESVHDTRSDRKKREGEGEIKSRKMKLGNLKIRGLNSMLDEYWDLETSEVKI